MIQLMAGGGGSTTHTLMSMTLSGKISEGLWTTGATSAVITRSPVAFDLDN